MQLSPVVTKIRVKKKSVLSGLLGSQFEVVLFVFDVGNDAC